MSLASLTHWNKENNQNTLNMSSEFSNNTVQRPALVSNTAFFTRLLSRSCTPSLVKWYNIRESIIKKYLKMFFLNNGSVSKYRNLSNILLTLMLVHVDFCHTAHNYQCQHFKYCISLISFRVNHFLGSLKTVDTKQKWTKKRAYSIRIRY